MKDNRTDWKTLRNWNEFLCSGEVASSFSPKVTIIGWNGKLGKCMHTPTMLCRDDGTLQPASHAIKTSQARRRKLYIPCATKHDLKDAIYVVGELWWWCLMIIWIKINVEIFVLKNKYRIYGCMKNLTKLTYSKFLNSLYLF